MRGAIAEAGSGLPGAVGEELRGAARALALGERTEVVLERLRANARCGAWDAIVAAIALQRSSGGDLARLLRDLAARHRRARPLGRGRDARPRRRRA